MFGRYLTAPVGVAFANPENLSGPHDRSRVNIALGRGLPPLQPTAIFNPAYFSGGDVRDAASRAPATWTQSSAEQSAPNQTLINGLPAIQYSRGQSRRFLSPMPYGGGSFGIIVTIATSADEANAFPSLLFGIGSDNPPVCHARYQDGTIKFFATNVDGQGRIETGVGAGFAALAFSYDADAGTGAVIGPNGVIGSAAFAAPPAGYPVEIGGWHDAGFGFAGKQGVMIFCARSLHSDANVGATIALLGALKTAYGA